MTAVKLTRTADGVYQTPDGAYLATRESDNGKAWRAYSRTHQQRNAEASSLHTCRGIIATWLELDELDERNLASVELESAPVDPVAAVAAAVAELAERTDELVAACTSPDAADLVLLLADVRDTRKALADVEAMVEHHAVRQLMADELEVPGVLRAERKRGRSRTEWRHEDWQRDVRDKAMRAHGLLGASVFDAQGNELELAEVFTALADVQSAHGASAPKVTALRKLGLDAGDYCTTAPGRATVTITRLAAEGQADDESEAA